MQLIKVEDIVIKPNRQRQEFNAEAMNELLQGIQARGLMHAPVLREENGQMVLVAGERRLRAIADLRMLGSQLKFNNELVPPGFVPYVNIGELDPLQAEEAELEENVCRSDLTWQERSAALSKLHSIRSRQAQAEGRVHTVADTAMEVKGRSDGAYHQQVKTDIIVANHLHNPLVAKAKDAKEALKIIKKQEEVKKTTALAAAVGKTFNASVHEVHNVNCLSWMRTADPEQFDIILTDPPYGMGADTFGDAGGKMTGIEHHYKDDYDSWKALMLDWCSLAYRVAKLQAHAYVFCDIDNFHELKKMMQQAGWYVFRTPFICVKPDSGRVPLPDQGPRRQWECLLYAIKGKKHTTAIYSDVIQTLADKNMTHGAQKPVALYENLLQRSARPGDKVLDSFGGSGTLLPAAHRLKCYATVLEMNPEYYGLCVSRLKALEEQDSPAHQQLNAELAGLLSR